MLFHRRDTLDDARGLARFLRKLLGAKGDIRHVTFFEAGRSFRCYVWDDSLWGAFKDNLILSEYERADVRLADRRGLVIDAGAHVGLFCLRVSPHADRVIALEPDPANFNILTLNLKRNQVSNVESLELALSPSANGAVLEGGPESGGGRIIGAGGSGWRVKSVRLEDLISEYGPVDLLKVDIEGSEFEVFDTASDAALREISAIVCELHLRSNEGRDVTLAERLGSLGFDVTLLEPPIFDWRDSVPRILRSWRKSRDLFRTKVIVLAVYAVAPVIGAILGDPTRMNPDQLRFLYAVRSAR
jgi:FkbM family methyltransferase